MNLLITWKWNFATYLSFCGNRSHMRKAINADRNCWLTELRNKHMENIWRYDNSPSMCDNKMVWRVENKVQRNESQISVHSNKNIVSTLWNLSWLTLICTTCMTRECNFKKRKKKKLITRTCVDPLMKPIVALLT